MLTFFRVSNFKSLANVEFRPAGMNLLVGGNNAGKTNLCQALRFLSLTARMPVDAAVAQCVPESWNFLNVYSDDDTSDLEVSCKLGFDGESLEFRYQLRLKGERRPGRKSAGVPFSVASEKLTVSGGRFSDTVLLSNDEGAVKLLHEKKYQPGVEPFYPETRAPLDATMLLRLYDLETNQRANLFKQYLASWDYHSFTASAMRSSVATPMDGRLAPNGGNLSSVLYALHNERPRDERKLLDAAKRVESKLDLVSFQCPDPEHVYMFLEDREGHRFGVQSLSDGTLHFLGICFLVLSNRKQDRAAPFSPLVIIEEPENGIFVGHLKPLFEKIDPSGEQGQFIFTSHNPYFIDLLDGHIDGLHVVRWAGSHSTLTKPAPGRIRDLLGSFSLGEMHFRGLLE